MNIHREPPQNPRFKTTHWSVVLRAGVADSENGRKALDELITAYWYPLYAFSRRVGNNHHDAMDLTQGFFAHLLASDGLDHVAPEKGRFRSFLLSSFKNFMANQRRAAGTIRRGGAVAILSMATVNFDSRYDSEPTDGDAPELLFQRQWAASLLQRVHSRLAEDYRLAGKQQLFELLEPHLSDANDAPSRAEISRQLNLSAAAVAMSIYRMRRRFGDLLRQEVAITVDDPADIEDELRALITAVGCNS